MLAIRRSTKWILAVCVAVMVVVTCGFVPASPAAKTEIWVGGTMAPALHDPASLGSNLLQDAIFDDVSQTIKVPYARTLGIVTFPYVYPYYKSIDDGSNNIVTTVTYQVMIDPSGTMVVTCISQGCDAVSIAVQKLEAVNFDTSSLTVVTQGNPSNNVGGLRNVLAFGYVPGAGAILGGNTSPSYTPVIQKRNQYDLVADMPNYFNLLSILNAGVAFLQHGHEYVGPLYGSNDIVTTSSDGLITDVFAPWQGVVPLLRPFEMLGVPTSVLKAVNDPIQDFIELGYDRSYYGQPGMYPSEPVRMKLLPPPSLLVPGLMKFAVDVVSSMQKLSKLALQPLPGGPVAPLASHAVDHGLNPGISQKLTTEGGQRDDHILPEPPKMAQPHVNRSQPTAESFKDASDDTSLTSEVQSPMSDSQEKHRKDAVDHSTRNQEVVNDSSDTSSTTSTDKDVSKSVQSDSEKTAASGASNESDFQAHTSSTSTNAKDSSSGNSSHPSDSAKDSSSSDSNSNSGGGE